MKKGPACQDNIAGRTHMGLVSVSLAAFWRPVFSLKPSRMVVVKQLQS